MRTSDNIFYTILIFLNWHELTIENLCFLNKHRVVLNLKKNIHVIFNIVTSLGKKNSDSKTQTETDPKNPVWIGFGFVHFTRLVLGSGYRFGSRYYPRTNRIPEYEPSKLTYIEAFAILVSFGYFNIFRAFWYLKLLQVRVFWYFLDF